MMGKSKKTLKVRVPGRQGLVTRKNFPVDDAIMYYHNNTIIKKDLKYTHMFIPKDINTIYWNNQTSS